MAPEPKQFTDEDIDASGQFKRISADRGDLISAPTWWQQQGLQETASGYGKRLNTGLKIRFCGRDYRVYCTCFSNAGTCWFETKKHGRIIVG